MNPRRPRWRRAIAGLVAVAVAVGGAAYGGDLLYRHITTSLISPGCQAGTGDNALSIDTDQAPVAATIAGVAARMGLPARAVEIAYATALQESKMTNLTSGDLDSVGVFQQRPSEGWGTVAQLEDPQYAATAFFVALRKVPNYLTIPMYQAAQDVQHSADGSAYQQWEPEATQLAAAFTSPHAVTCWYNPSSTGHPQLSQLQTRISQVFGPLQPGEVVTAATTASRAAGPSMTVTVRPQEGWLVAQWVMSHASLYGVTTVRYDGWQWSASLTESSWQAAASGGTGSILAS